MSGEAETSQTEQDLEALEGFQVGNRVQNDWKYY
jgi:hypothetical protein